MARGFPQQPVTDGPAPGPVERTGEVYADACAIVARADEILAQRIRRTRYSDGKRRVGTRWIRGDMAQTADRRPVDVVSSVAACFCEVGAVLRAGNFAHMGADLSEEEVGRIIDDRALAEALRVIAVRLSQAANVPLDDDADFRSAVRCTVSLNDDGRGKWAQKPGSRYTAIRAVNARAKRDLCAKAQAVGTPDNGE